MKTLWILAALSPLAWAAVPADAKPRVARCAITSAGQKPFAGACRFTPEAKGSFALAPVGRKTFTPNVTAVSVYVVEPDIAEVSGLTSSGNNSRWGTARRSKRDRACWSGSDFSVCVY